MKYYAAPWSKLLIGTSTFLTILFLGIVFVAAQQTRGPAYWLAWLPVLLALICALFSIRGYTVAPDEILVHRLFWSTHLPRRGLNSARIDPTAMRGSIRTFGNGGLYSFTGRYWNRSLGSYRAFVTDPRLAVVLQYTPKKTVVLSPQAPEAFVADLGLKAA